MNIFALELWDDEGDKCTFYTVKKEDATENEADRFFNKYDSIPELKRSLQELLSLVLESIGDDHGAIDCLFNRFENLITGLPNRGKVHIDEIVFIFPDFPLRLYALRVNNRTDCVILFNGGIKSAQTNQDSKDLSMKFKEACLFAKRIEEALHNKEIYFDPKQRKIFSTNGEEDIYL